MFQGEIALFSCEDEETKRVNKIGNVSVQQSGKNIWTQIIADGLAPNDCYVIFYILQNSKQKQGITVAGMTTVSQTRDLFFEKTLPNQILDGYYYDEKEIVAVILIEKNDINLKAPIVGFQGGEIPWKPMLKSYIQALPCNHTNVYAEYKANAAYDNIIDNAPESICFEKRDKVDKAVEISNFDQLEITKMNFKTEIPCGHKKLLLMRLRTGNAILYALGVPDSFSTKRKVEYVRFGFGAFFCNHAWEYPCGDAQGYWCAYL